MLEKGIVADAVCGRDPAHPVFQSFPVAKLRVKCPMPNQPGRHRNDHGTLAQEVRNRLKILAVRLDKTMNELMAKALEDLFTKYDDK